MKKTLVLFLFIIFSNASASENFTTNFTIGEFKKAQENGETVVVYSWNKYCGTCAKQKPIIEQAQKDFDKVLFFYIEHDKHKDLVINLNINFWSTIAIYKNNEQIASATGLIDKDKIYSLIKKGI